MLDDQSFKKCNLIKIIARRLSYELVSYDKKKVNGDWNIIKNGLSEYDTLHTSKPKKVNRGNIYYEIVTSKLTEEEDQW